MEYINMRKNYEILMPIVHDIYIQTDLVKSYFKTNLLVESDIEKLWKF